MAVTAEHLYEQTLVLRSQIGDEAAFEELLRHYGPSLMRFTQKMMQAAPNMTEDIVQEIWVAIFRGLPSLRDVSKFRPWAFRIARDRIYREYRRRKIASVPVAEADLEDALTVEAEAPADTEALQKCLESISPEHREALMLCYFEEMSYEEIARVTGSSIGTVRSRIFYGKRALKNVWKEKYE